MTANKRRWFQFSLKWFLLATALAGMLFAGFVARQRYLNEWNCIELP